MNTRAALALTLTGAAALIAGALLIYMPAGVLLAGVLLIATGLLVDDGGTT